MNPLIAVVTCEKFRPRADAQRQVWTHRVQGMDTRFFLAKQDREPLPDEVFLDVPDDYHSLPLKVKHMHNWALSQGYTQVLKTDDDTVINPARLLAAIPPQEYAGFLNATPPKPWCSGFAYWISERAMRFTAEAPIPEGEWAEDRWVGGVLYDHGIRPYWDRRYGLLIKGWREPDYSVCVALCDCRPNPQSLSELYTKIA